ncbi:MAG: L-2-amino-thiazoline-4-carboxylic acid hydrolase [Synergistales bacterium]|nr:L-2-amino-thiazoline-4-carboxylic acid hydrolase [Synergistales bacterium]
MTDEKKISLRTAEEQVAKVCRRLALLHLSFARTLVEELGEERGKELVLKAVRNYGIRIGRAAKEKALASGLDNRPENYMEDLPEFGMHKGVAGVCKEGERRTIARGCVMGELWREIGEEALGRLYCYVDVAKFMGFNEHFKLIHTACMPDGDRECEFALRETSEEERQDFADPGKDWRYIDR